MSDDQCPNCGGYKVRVEDRTWYFPMGVWYILTGLFWLAFFCVGLFMLLAAGGFSMRAFFIFLFVTVISILGLIGLRKLIMRSVDTDALYCNICGYTWDRNSVINARYNEATNSRASSHKATSAGKTISSKDEYDSRMD